MRIAIKVPWRICCLMTGLAWCSPPCVWAETNLPTGSESRVAVVAQVTPGYVVDLQRQLEMGLRAARPIEFQFIEVVVARVADGTLPYAMVQSTFLWARKQPDRPMVYFQQALTFRAAQIGIQL